VTETRAAPFVVHTATFEGPLEQLLRLVQQGEVDVSALPLAEIAAAYLTHSRAGFDVEEATEAIWTLAALVELKARALLPQPPPPEEPPPEEPGDLDAAMEERVAAYRAFKDVATAMRALETYQQRVFLRPGEEPAGALLTGVALPDLMRAFQEVLARGRERPREVIPEPITLAERMAALMELLTEATGEMAFQALFPGEATRLEIVVTFLALLELIRLARVGVRREGPDGTIQIFLRTNADVHRRMDAVLPGRDAG
jgi:segregation and condensation protein A